MTGFSLLYFWSFPSRYFWSRVNQIFMQKDQWLPLACSAFKVYYFYFFHVLLCDARTHTHTNSHTCSTSQKEGFLLFKNRHIHSRWTLTGWFIERKRFFSKIAQPTTSPSICLVVAVTWLRAMKTLMGLSHNLSLSALEIKDFPQVFLLVSSYRLIELFVTFSKMKCS